MPSSTGMGDAEKSSSGNSGNPATSQKLSNAGAVQIRGANSASAVKFASKVTTTELQVSNSSVGQPPSVQKQTAVNGKNSPSYAGSLSTDTYRNSDNPASRPSRQYGEPDQETIATMAVRTFDGTSVIEGFASFFLQGVAESEQEKYQVVETFTAYYAFFYGKRPPIYTYSGMLLNDADNNWTSTFRYLYENFFRGTSSAELGAETVLSYDKRVVSGYLLSLNINQDAISDKGVPFSFSVLVISHTLVELSNDYKNFITVTQDELKALKDRASSEIASLNKNPDTLQTILKGSILSGKAPTSFASITGKDETPRPDSNILTSKAQTQEQLTQVGISSTLSPGIVTGNDLVVPSGTSTSSSSSGGFSIAGIKVF